MDSPAEGMGMLPPTPVKNSNRVIGLTVVVIVHVILIAALASGLAKTAISVIKGPLEAALLQEQQQADLPPPPPPKVEDLPQSNIVPPDINIETPVITEAPKAVAPPPPVAVAAPISQEPIVPPKSNNKNVVNQDDYPPVSRRLGEEGIVMVKIGVTDTGGVGSCAIQKSSGHDRLDLAACQIAKSKFHFTPAMQGGKAVAAPVTIGVSFKLS
jgi:protein TonB